MKSVQYSMLLIVCRFAAAIWILMSSNAASEPTEIPVHVSIIRILADPESLNGKRVSTEGYMHVKFEEDAIYIDKTSFDNGLTANAIWLSTEGVDRSDLSELSGKYVKITGTYLSGYNGHMGLYSGTLTSPSVLVEIATREEYRNAISKMRLAGLWTDWWPKLVLVGIFGVILGMIALIRRGRRR
jgi:hypothetical protein